MTSPECTSSITMPTRSIPCAAYCAISASTAGPTTGDHVGVQTRAVGLGAGVSGTMIRGGGVCDGAERAVPDCEAGTVTGIVAVISGVFGERASHQTAPAL